MISDKFGNTIYQTKDLVDLLYRDFSSFEDLTVEVTDEIKQFEKFAEIHLKTIDPNLYAVSIEDFDQACQSDWFIPEEYKTFDVKQYCLGKCSPAHLSRALEEFEAFEARNMIPLLRTLKYLVDAMRVNNVVWGVGRGSSVASYVLFLLEVHRIDSIKYDLDWREFLR